MFGIGPFQLLLILGMLGILIGVPLVILVMLLSGRQKNEGPDFKPERLEER